MSISRAEQTIATDTVISADEELAREQEARGRERARAAALENDPCSDSHRSLVVSGRLGILRQTDQSDLVYLSDGGGHCCGQDDRERRAVEVSLPKSIVLSPASV
jgi:hypothetical protein